MYWCERCKQPVEEPVIEKDDNGVGGSWVVELCPYCGEPLDEADTCDWCGEWKDPDKPLCPACHEEFTRSFWGWVEGWIPSAGTSEAVIDMVFELFSGGEE